MQIHTRASGACRRTPIGRAGAWGRNGVAELSPAAFWALHAAIAAGGGVAIALFGSRLRRALQSG